MAAVDEVGSLPHQSLLALVWTCFSAAAFFVGLRTIIRFKVVDRFSGEDVWILLALATLLTFCILETIQLTSLYYMTGVIAGVIPVSAELIDYGSEYLRFEFPIIVLFWTVLWCVKASFLALYYKLFRELPVYRYIWYSLAVFTLLAYIGCILTLTFSCHPSQNFFEFAQCGKPEDIWGSNLSVYYSTVIDVFTDVCIMAMPIRLIYNVKISFKQKAGLVAVFGLCFVMIAFAIIRAKQILVEQYFVNLTLLMVWSTLAASISVIVGSLPAFKLFLTNRSAKRSNYGSSAGRRGGVQGSNGSNARSPKVKSVPLGSFSSDKKSPIGRRADAADSQEEILESGESRFIMVKNDVSVSYNDSGRSRPIVHQNHQLHHPHPLSQNRPQPIYDNRPPVSTYGEAF